MEYESGNNGLLPGSTQNQNVPCARCLSRGTAVMMLPAKRTCPQGWTKEYEGIVEYHIIESSVAILVVIHCVNLTIPCQVYKTICLATIMI